MRFRLIFICLILAHIWPQTAFSANIDLDRLVDAIYYAEGGTKASVPYGLIYSGWCIDEPGHCRYYAKEIVRIHLERCKDGEEPIACVGRQYAPVSHHEMNRRWVKNVRHYYDKTQV